MAGSTLIISLAMTIERADRTLAIIIDRIFLGALFSVALSASVFGAGLVAQPSVNPQSPVVNVPMDTATGSDPRTRDSEEVRAQRWRNWHNQVIPPGATGEHPISSDPQTRDQR